MKFNVKPPVVIFTTLFLLVLIGGLCVIFIVPAIHMQVTKNETNT